MASIESLPGHPFNQRKTSFSLPFVPDFLALGDAGPPISTNLLEVLLEIVLQAGRDFPNGNDGSRGKGPPRALEPTLEPDGGRHLPSKRGAYPYVVVGIMLVEQVIAVDGELDRMAH
jgi:hypothetical protein